MCPAMFILEMGFQFADNIFFQIFVLTFAAIT